MSRLPLFCIRIDGARPEFIRVPVLVLVTESIIIRKATAESGGMCEGIALDWHSSRYFP